MLESLLPHGSRRRRVIAKAFRRRHPVDPAYIALAANFRELDAAELAAVEAGLTSHYFSSWSTFPEGPDPERYLATEAGAADLQAHLLGRIDVARRQFVPWVNSVVELGGARILEVGCGTGSSTVALMEQGARVTGLDLDQDSLDAARFRLAAYGFDPDLLVGNATQLAEIADLAAYDAVIFYASVEHMTLDERLQSLSSTWRAMKQGACLVITDTPNRLWYFDHHTSLTNFFLWLPDDLALRYAARTPRERFNSAFASKDLAENSTALARWGRGVSYHDFEVALDMPVDDLPMVSGMEPYLRTHLPSHATPATSADAVFEEALRAVSGGVHEAWLLPNLDVALRKHR